MRVSYTNEANHLRERAAEMRGSSKELKDNDTAAVIMRLADLYDRLAARAEFEAVLLEVTQKRSCMIGLPFVKVELLRIGFQCGFRATCSRSSEKIF